jgi:hypothetical protein
MEPEMRKGIYTGRKKGKGTRWEIYMNEGGEEDRRYSAFEPLLNLDQLKENREYTYQVVHVPTKDDPNKFHHNFGRVGKDLDFVIEWTGEEKKPAPIQAKVTDAPKPYTPQPGRTQTDDREKYWAEREKRDKEKERIYELRLPYINAVNLMPGVCAIIAGMMNHAQGYEEVKKIGIDKTAELLLRQMEAIVQQRLPAEAAYQQPKTEKKEPIEAEV